MAPAEFIPVAEQTGLILPIGRWAINEAVSQLKRWRDAMPALRPLSMSVNLSGRQLADPRLVEEIATALETNGVPPQAGRECTFDFKALYADDPRASGGVPKLETTRT